MVDPKKKRYFYMMMAGFGAIGLSILFSFLLYRMQGVGELVDRLTTILSPFIYGSIVAYLLRPMCNAYEHFLERHLPTMFRKAAPVLAVVGSLLTFLVIIYALIAMIVPKVYDSVVSLWNAIPGKINGFINWLEVTFGEDERMDTYLSVFNTSYERLYQDIDAWSRENLTPMVTSLVTGVGGSVFKIVRAVYDLLVGLIVAVYLLFSRKRFATQGSLIVHSVLPEKWADAVLGEVHLVDRMFGGFIDSKILDSAIVGVLCYLGCGILQIPNTLLVSVFVGVTNIIPFFGPLIGAVPSTLLILIEDPLKAVWFVIFVLVLQQLDGNVIGPRIMGEHIGLSGFWVMFAIIFFGGVWGIMGMVVGVPLTAVIYDLARKLVKYGLQRRHKGELWDQYVAQYPDKQSANEKKPKKSMEDREKELRQLFREIGEGCKAVWHGAIRFFQGLKQWLASMWQKITAFFGAVGSLFRRLWQLICGLVSRLRGWVTGKK